MSLFGDISDSIKNTKKDRKETIRIFTEIGKDKEKIIESLRKISEMSFKMSKWEEENIPKGAVRGTKEWRVMIDNLVHKENRERDGYLSQLNGFFNIKIDRKYVDKVVRYVKNKDKFYELESGGLTIGVKKYIKTLKYILKD